MADAGPTSSYGWIPGKGTATQNRAGGRAGAAGTGPSALGRLAGCLRPMIIVVLLGGAVAIAIAQAAGFVQLDNAATQARYRFVPVGGSASTKPGEPGGPVEVVTLANAIGPGSPRAVIDVVVGAEAGTDTSGLVWSSESLPSDVYSSAMATTGDNLFVSAGDEVWNLSPTSGTLRWKATVSDTVTPNCDECFQVVDGTLVVRSQDATVTAFSAESPEPRWSRRLDSPAGSVMAAGDRVAILDEKPGAGGQILMLDPASGKTQASITPTCTSDVGPAQTYRATGLAVAVPDSGDIVTVLGSGSDCVARFDGATGKQRWESKLDGAQPFGNDAPFIDAEHLVFSLGSGAPVHVALSTGAVSTLAAEPELKVTGRSVIDGVLLADTVTTRGTPRGGLGAWDLKTGTALWASELPGQSQPVSASFDWDALIDGQPRTLLVDTGKSPLLVTFDGELRQIRTQQVDLATGQLGAPATRPLPARSPTDPILLSVVSAGAARLVIDTGGQLAVVPLPDGEIVAWP